jgi:hypothetical protein
MLFLNLTALSIYHLFGRFGPFHVASVISLATICAGFVPAVLIVRQVPKILAGDRIAPLR